MSLRTANWCGCTAVSDGGALQMQRTLAGAIRPPFGTALDDRSCREKGTDCHGSQMSLAMTVVK